MADKLPHSDQPLTEGGNPGIKRAQKQPGQDLASPPGGDGDSGTGPGREQDGPGEKPARKMPRQPG